MKERKMVVERETGREKGRGGGTGKEIMLYE